MVQLLVNATATLAALAALLLGLTRGSSFGGVVWRTVVAYLVAYAVAALLAALARLGLASGAEDRARANDTGRGGRPTGGTNSAD